MRGLNAQPPLFLEEAMPNTAHYRVTPVIELTSNQKRPQDQRQVMTRPHKLARVINQYYLDCVNKSDMWGDPNDVAAMIEEVYGNE